MISHLAYMMIDYLRPGEHITVRKLRGHRFMVEVGTERCPPSQRGDEPEGLGRDDESVLAMAEVLGADLPDPDRMLREIRRQTEQFTGPGPVDIPD